MMSKMNHQIITSELRKLSEFLITSSVNYSSAKIAFEPNLFDGDYNYVPDQNFQSAPLVQNLNTIKNDIIKDTNYPLKGQNEIEAKNIKSNSNEKVSLTKTVAPEKIVKDKNSRQEIILSMLKSGVKL